MIMNYISRIQKNLSSRQVIDSRRATTNILDGSYKSVFKGKSLEFDELREYVPGDDVKDMDWKASSRSRKLLVRQYIAEKKHNVLFVFDTNRRMLAASGGMEEKRDLAIMTAGTLAYFVNKNTDFVGALYKTKTSVNYMPLKAGLGNVESILEGYYKEVTDDNKTDINDTLDFLLRNFRKRMIVIIVTDVEGASLISEDNIKKLMVMNDVLLVNVSDADFSDAKLYDMGSDGYINRYFAKDKKLQKILKEQREEKENAVKLKLQNTGVCNATIHKTEDIEFELAQMLKRHRLEKR